MADVPQCGGTQQGVGQRMKHHVAIGVCLDAVGVGNAHAAQHDVIPRAEAMDVEALPDTHRAHNTTASQFSTFVSGSTWKTPARMKRMVTAARMMKNQGEVRVAG